MGHPTGGEAGGGGEIQGRENPEGAGLVVTLQDLVAITGELNSRGGGIDGVTPKSLQWMGLHTLQQLLDLVSSPPGE